MVLMKREALYETKEKLFKIFLQLQDTKLNLLISINRQDSEISVIEDLKQKFEDVAVKEKRLFNMVQADVTIVARSYKTIDSLIKLNDLELGRYITIKSLNILNNINGFKEEEDNLNEVIKTISRAISKEKAKLKRNLLALEPEIRKFLADIRSAHLYSQNKARINNIGLLTSKMDRVKAEMKNVYHTEESLNTLNEDMEQLKKFYQSERRLLKIDQEEEAFWNFFDRLPACKIGA